MDESEDIEPTPEPWTPHWRDEHGVVHIMGTHTNTRAYTECSQVVVSRESGDDWAKHYEAIRDAPTCIQCIAEVSQGETFERLSKDTLRTMMDRSSFTEHVLQVSRVVTTLDVSK